MSEIVIVEGGIRFTAASVDAEPTVLDLDVATKLGYKRPRDIRQLIGRMLESGALTEREVCCTVQQTSKKGGRPGTEYRLTEFGCDLVGGRSETPEGIAHYREMVGFYSNAKRQLRELQHAEVTAQLATATTERDDALALVAGKDCRIATHSDSTTQVSSKSSKRWLGLVWCSSPYQTLGAESSAQRASTSEPYSCGLRRLTRRASKSRSGRCLVCATVAQTSELILQQRINSGKRGLLYGTANLWVDSSARNQPPTNGSKGGRPGWPGGVVAAEPGRPAAAPAWRKPTCPSRDAAEGKRKQALRRFF